jgi:glutamate-1-semialdehyde 2,1-aminomutase
MIADDPGVYARLDARGERIACGVTAAAADAGVPVTVNRVGSMLTVFFTAESVTDYATAKRSDTGRFGAFFRAMLDSGVYLPPSQFEAAFLSDALCAADEEHILSAAREAFAQLGRG